MKAVHQPPVILSEAKDLLFPRASEKQTLGSAQGDIVFVDRAR